MKKDKPNETGLAPEKRKPEKPKKERTKKKPQNIDKVKKSKSVKSPQEADQPKKSKGVKPPQEASHPKKSKGVKSPKEASQPEKSRWAESTQETAQPKKSRWTKSPKEAVPSKKSQAPQERSGADKAKSARAKEALSYIDQPRKTRLKRERFIDQPKRDKWKKVGILIVVFVLAILISSLILNQGTRDITVGFSDPALPRVAFDVRNQRVNALEGYVDEMDITAMRDTITPIADNGRLDMYVEADGQEIAGIRYEVYSLNGEDVYLQNAVKDLSGEKVTLELGNALPEDVQEGVLRVALRVGSDEEKETFYYTRIERQDELSVKECMDFAKKHLPGTRSSAGIWNRMRRRTTPPCRPSIFIPTCSISAGATWRRRCPRRWSGASRKATRSTRPCWPNTRLLPLGTGKKRKPTM